MKTDTFLENIDIFSTSALIELASIINYNGDKTIDLKSNRETLLSEIKSVSHDLEEFFFFNLMDEDFTELILNERFIDDTTVMELLDLTNEEYLSLVKDKKLHLTKIKKQLPYSKGKSYTVVCMGYEDVLKLMEGKLQRVNKFENFTDSEIDTYNKENFKHLITSLFLENITKITPVAPDISYNIYLYQQVLNSEKLTPLLTESQFKDLINNMVKYISEYLPIINFYESDETKGIYRIIFHKEISIKNEQTEESLSNNISMTTVGYEDVTINSSRGYVEINTNLLSFNQDIAVEYLNNEFSVRNKQSYEEFLADVEKDKVTLLAMSMMESLQDSDISQLLGENGIDLSKTEVYSGDGQLLNSKLDKESNEKAMEEIFMKTLEDTNLIYSSFISLAMNNKDIVLKTNSKYNPSADKYIGSLEEVLNQLDN